MTTWSYDAAGRVTKIANLKSDGSVISSFDYAYDAAGNRTSVLEVSGARVTWTYDATNQLLSERRSVNNTYHITHTYDAAGNRTVQNSSVNGTRTTYVYDAADQLTSSDASTSSSRTVTTFTYDANGNLATEKENGTVTVTNTWDDENRRTKLQMVSGGPGDYAYNADGQRVLKTISGAQTRLVWDGEAYLMELDGSNVTNAVYTVAPGAFGMLLAQRRKSGAVWTPSHYLFDALGSTDRLLSAAQAVTDSYVYRAFGELASSTGSTTNPFRWVGKLGYYYDPIGTQSDYYVRARWYKPVQARWLSIDPLGFAAGDYNLFRYVGNRVVLLNDPSGLFIHTDEADECREFMRRWREGRKPNQQACEKCKGVIQRVLDEAERRRGSRGRDSEQHCWAACEFGRIAGFGGWLGPLGAPTGLGGGLGAAFCADIGEILLREKDWLDDIDAQHRGAACAGLVVSTFGYLNCDDCCGSCPIK